LASAHSDDHFSNADYFDRAFDGQPDVKEQDATPKTFSDAWRGFTPSLMDPNSYAFSAFANQPPGYYTPTPGGFGTLYHPQAGVLHTPGMGMNTPLSLPHSIHGLHAQDQMIHLQQHFNPHLLHQQHPFQDLFHHQPPPVHVPTQQPQSFAPQQFLQHQDSGYVAMDDTPHKTTPTQAELGVENQPANQPIQQSMPGLIDATGLPMGEKSVTPYSEQTLTDNRIRFRFHTTLNAPTAMVRHADEIPITYLNKGQA